MLTLRTAVIVGLVAAGGLLAGCASAATSAALSAGAPMHAPARAGAVTAGVAAPIAPGIAVGVPPTAYVQRSVSAAYTVPSGTFLTSFDGVIARAVTLGGYVASSATTPDRSGRIVAGSVTLQIPATAIATFLNHMPSTFVASSIDFTSIDHHAAFVDVTARLASSRAHLQALNALFARATTLGDITTIEQQIEAVQVEIDTYQGELNGLTASVAMSTATVALTERGATLVATQPGAINDGLASGWQHAVQVTAALLDGLVTALPVIVLAALGLAVWRLGPRRMRRSPPTIP